MSTALRAARVLRLRAAGAARLHFQKHRQLHFQMRAVAQRAAAPQRQFGAVAALLGGSALAALAASSQCTDGPTGSAAFCAAAAAPAEAPEELLVEMKRRKTELLEKHLAAGGSPNLVDSQQRSLLFLAVFHNNIDAFDLLMAKGADIHRPNEFGLTPLEVACWRGRLSMLKQLLAAGADPDSCDQFGLHPLHKATGFGHDAIITELIARARVDVNVLTDEATAPEDFDAHSELETALHIAARRGNESTVRTLLHFNAQVHSVNRHGETPLHVAIRNCTRAHHSQSNWRCVLLLLEAGASLTAVSHKNQTPLDFASIPMRLAFLTHTFEFFATHFDI
eukprot:m.75851 g.75851  ORF g.75851 m.75851 type:complete len:337 (-) comp8097_c0_seq3:1955-2965(-)